MGRQHRFAIVWLLCSTSFTLAQDPQDAGRSDEAWRAVDEAIQRAIAWIVSTQESNGSFPSVPHGQPAITSFGVLAMLAQGE